MLAGEERLRPLPGTPYPAVIEDSRQISPQALVSWKGNLYSVPPGRPREQAIVRHQLGADTVDILTPAGKASTFRQTKWLCESCEKWSWTPDH